MCDVVYFIGVDVGTGSARAALVTHHGKIVKSAVADIQTWNPQPDFYEQSSQNIWDACVQCIRTVTADVNPDLIHGLGFDATCSLVALDYTGNPLSTSPTNRNEQNIILWMDHRAAKETQHINARNHPVLKYVGGKVSLEMEIPKLLWLKNNHANWEKYGLFFDLPDFLTWKATNCKSRSLCSLVCKWNYETDHWNWDYLEQIGLQDLRENRIGSEVIQPGSPLDTGLSLEASRELGLKCGTPVGASIIDAHAGGLGLIGCKVPHINSDFTTRLSLICGTSTCHMAVARTPCFVPGIWGPYFSAMVPGMWLNEGGQSTTGKLLDHIIDSHPASTKIRAQIGEKHIQIYLSEVLRKLAMREGLESEAFLTKDVHVWPDFHGNRSPIADPTLRGAICGLSLAEDEDSLALLYLATVQALAYGTRHIIETLEQNNGYNFDSVLICGGLSKNALFIQTQADVINLSVVCPNEPESVLLGSAILGACASGFFPNIEEAIAAMSCPGTVVNPINAQVVKYHRKKYQVFLRMYQDQCDYRSIMNESP